MGKDKLIKWAENKTFSHVFEPPLIPIIKEGKSFDLKGKWRKEFFHNENPLVIELGCGKGEYTVELAKRYPQKNFIGIDVKGHRFHKGAKQAHLDGLKNVAFIRMRIEFIEVFFEKEEVDEIWITFCDPQPLDHDGKRRITSPWYLEKYKSFAKKESLLYLKHDNDMVYERALKDWPKSGFAIEKQSDDVYGTFFTLQSEELQKTLNIQTFYEAKWLAEGKKIKFIQTKFLSA